MPVRVKSQQSISSRAGSLQNNRNRSRWFAAALLSLIAMTGWGVSPAQAGEVSPIEARILREFPAVSMASTATLEAVDSIVAGRNVHSLRPRFATAKPVVAASLGRSPVDAALEQLALRDGF